jgi:hypothetical protein
MPERSCCLSAPDAAFAIGAAALPAAMQTY